MDIVFIFPEFRIVRRWAGAVLCLYVRDGRERGRVEEGRGKEGEREIGQARKEFQLPIEPQCRGPSLLDNEYKQ